MKTFSKELKKLRVDLEITQSQMAKSLLVSPAYLSAVERGKQKVTDRLLENIYTVYDVILDDLAIIHNGVLDISDKPDYQQLTMFNMNKQNLSEYECEQINRIIKL